MVKTVKEMSVAELERLLDSKKDRLESLQRKRDQLERQLNSVVEKINSMEGKRATLAAAKSRKTATRPKNDRSLKEVVTELLAANKKGYGLDELSKKVLETGYKTSSTNFKNTLYQCLYNHERINLDKSTGLYRLV
ncbi:MAG TPA: hypothetical protein VHB77_14815 [Planctomycetaceae bacterium]|nr:hypothetical protein [Planctomycetaceae bacterium]